jgi:hypothetical protein
MSGDRLGFHATNCRTAHYDKSKDVGGDAGDHWQGDVHSAMTVDGLRAGDAMGL